MSQADATVTDGWGPIRVLDGLASVLVVAVLLEAAGGIASAVGLGSARVTSNPAVGSPCR